MINEGLAKNAANAFFKKINAYVGTLPKDITNADALEQLKNHLYQSGYGTNDDGTENISVARLSRLTGIEINDEPFSAKSVTERQTKILSHIKGATEEQKKAFRRIVKDPLSTDASDEDYAKAFANTEAEITPEAAEKIVQANSVKAAVTIANEEPVMLNDQGAGDDNRINGEEPGDDSDDRSAPGSGSGESDSREPESDDTPGSDPGSDESDDAEETPGSDGEEPVEPDDSPVEPDASSGSGTGPWATLLAHQDFITAVGIAAVLTTALIAGIKALGKTIKGRFQKCAKTLFTMQKDFATSPTGLDMMTIMGNKGNWFTNLFKTDTWARWIFGSKKIDKETQIGVYPFINMYRKELARDYAVAIQTFNAVATAGSVDGEEDNRPKIGESVEEPVNEAVLTSLLMAGGTMAARSAIRYFAGNFFVNKKDKNGKETAVKVQVTKASTREACMSIMFAFLEKYINMEALAQRAGIDVKSLNDLDAGSYEKFRSAIMRYRNSTDANVTKQYSRMQKAYTSMVDNYAKTGKFIIKNFETYTKKIKNDKGKEMSEKDANLLVVAANKLNTAWDQQINFLKDNFVTVAQEVTTSPEYIQYFDFIIEKVLPVFKSGLCGDADYVLDITPKKGEYYFVRQTLQGLTPVDPKYPDQGKHNNGNVALAVVDGFDNKSKTIKFKLIALAMGALEEGTDGWFINDGQYDKSVYADRKIETLSYGKWLALDPMAADVSQLPENIVGPEDNDEDDEDDDVTPKNVINMFESSAKIHICPDKSNSEKYNIKDYVFGLEDENESAKPIVDENGNSLNEADTVTPEISHILHAAFINLGKNKAISKADKNTDKVYDYVLGNPIALDVYNKMFDNFSVDGGGEKVTYKIVSNQAVKDKVTNYMTDAINSGWAEKKSIGSLADFQKLLLNRSACDVNDKNNNFTDIEVADIKTIVDNCGGAITKAVGDAMNDCLSALKKNTSPNATTTETFEAGNYIFKIVVRSQFGGNMSANNISIALLNTVAAAAIIRKSDNKAIINVPVVKTSVRAASDGSKINDANEITQFEQNIYNEVKTVCTNAVNNKQQNNESFETEYSKVVNESGIFANKVTAERTFKNYNKLNGEYTIYAELLEDNGSLCCKPSAVAYRIGESIDGMTKDSIKNKVKNTRNAKVEKLAETSSIHYNYNGNHAIYEALVIGQIREGRFNTIYTTANRL